MLVGSKVFSKLDLSHAYAQLNVDKESQEYLTIATHKGLYSYLRRLERVFRCTRAHNLHQDARVSRMNQNKLTGSYMLRKIARTGNKICGKHLLLAQNLVR